MEVRMGSDGETSSAHTSHAGTFTSNEEWPRPCVRGGGGGGGDRQTGGRVVRVLAPRHEGRGGEGRGGEVVPGREKGAFPCPPPPHG